MKRILFILFIVSLFSSCATVKHRAFENKMKGSWVAYSVLENAKDPGSKWKTIEWKTIESDERFPGMVVFIPDNRTFAYSPVMPDKVNLFGTREPSKATRPRSKDFGVKWVYTLNTPTYSGLGRTEFPRTRVWYQAAKDILYVEFRNNIIAYTR